MVRWLNVQAIKDKVVTCRRKVRGLAQLLHCKASGEGREANSSQAGLPGCRCRCRCRCRCCWKM